jgi:hypothetical protein
MTTMSISSIEDTLREATHLEYHLASFLGNNEGIYHHLQRLDSDTSRAAGEN